MSKCPNCNAPIMEGAKFCMNCGYSLVINEPKVEICPTCGFEVSGAKFCPQCGTSMKKIEANIDEKKVKVSLTKSQKAEFEMSEKKVSSIFEQDYFSNNQTTRKSSNEFELLRSTFTIFAYQRPRPRIWRRGLAKNIKDREDGD